MTPSSARRSLSVVEGGEVAGQVGLVLRRARQQSPAQAGVIIEQVSWSRDHDTLL